LKLGEPEPKNAFNPKSEGLIGGFPANERSPNPKSKIASVRRVARRKAIKDEDA
jgi:hypothetical protein